MRSLVPLAVVALLAGACAEGEPEAEGPIPTVADTTSPEPADSLDVESAAFSDGEAIPAEFSCDGEGGTPPLSWTGVPEEAAELALVVTDPDAPDGAFVHWVVYAMSPGTSGLERGAGAAVGVQGRNSAGETSWTPPCPPPDDDAHRYVFTLSAVSEGTGLGSGATADDLREAIEGTEIARGTLTGTYDR